MALRPLVALVLGLAAGCAPSRPASGSAPDAAPAPAPVTTAPADDPVGRVAPIPSERWSPRPGLALSPGVFLVQGVPTGVTVPLARVAPATVLTITNDSDDAGAFALTAGSPTAAGIAGWEPGYEPLPDAGWCRIEPAAVTVPPRSTVTVGVVVELPDRAALAGRRFAVGLRIARPDGGGIVMGLAGRMLLETAGAPLRSGDGVAPIVVDPPLAAVPSLTPGARATVAVHIANGTGVPAAYAFAGLAETVERADTRGRFASGGRTLLTEGGWARLPAGFALAAGEGRDVAITIAVPADAAPGDYEELLFVATRDGVATANRREASGPTAFVRLHYTVRPAR